MIPQSNRRRYGDATIRKVPETFKRIRKFLTGFNGGKRAWLCNLIIAKPVPFHNKCSLMIHSLTNSHQYKVMIPINKTIKRFNSKIAQFYIMSI